MAGKRVQRRRGTTAEHAGFIGANGEFTYDTTKKTIVAHDGSTAGGMPMAKEVSDQNLSIRKTTPTHTLEDPATSLVNNQVMGVYEVKQNDTDNPGVSARVRALADGTAGKLKWVFTVGLPSLLVDILTITDTGASIAGLLGITSNSASAAVTVNQAGSGVGVDIQTGGLRINKTGVVAPVAGDGNIFNGTYTPTLFNTSNVDSTTANLNFYTRIGNVVFVGYRITIDATASGTLTQVGMSLPIASTFSSNVDLAGLINGFGAAENGIVFSDTVNNRATIQLTAQSTGARTYYGTFMYRVL